MPFTGVLRTEGAEKSPIYGTKCLFVRDKEDVPHEDSLPDFYALGEDCPVRCVLARSKMTLPAGMELVGDSSEWDRALIVQPGTSASDMRKALAVVRLLGLEPLGEDEDEPELLEDGSVRLWLVPVNPDDPFESTEDMEATA
ncbi:hypothetical protein [Streptomyces sp. AC558_RSS880]|uniref:hypothetical protein n=1 Tax=Streptomyces sp. AC558_RSS880 TaxID=2823687 RepID=UPI001C23D725|nr:hypothetical protein [Streptomyces sp. AC558_RSS880]